MARYPGESEGKKAARLLLYTTSIFHLIGVQGDVLTLSGPEASEYAPLRILTRITGGRVIMADTDPAAAAAARSTGADVVHHGCVVDLMRSLRVQGRRLAFVHLDFMGHAGTLVSSALTAASRCLAPGGVVAVTFLRGRESASVFQNRHAAAIASTIERPGSISAAEGARAVRWNDALVGGLIPPRLHEMGMGAVRFYGATDRHLREIVNLRYFSVNSPMGVIAVKRIDAPSGTGCKIDNSCAVYKTCKSVRDDVTALFGSPLDCPLGLDLIAAATGVSRGTIAAWKAVKTRSARTSHADAAGGAP